MDILLRWAKNKGMKVAYTPDSEIKITAKTMIGVIGFIVSIAAAGGAVYWGVVNRIDNLEESKQSSRKEISSIQDDVGVIKAKVSTNEAVQATVLDQLKSIKEDQRTFLALIMKERLADYRQDKPSISHNANF